MTICVDDNESLSIDGIELHHKVPTIEFHPSNNHHLNQKKNWFNKNKNKFSLQRKIIHQVK